MRRKIGLFFLFITLTIVNSALISKYYHRYLLRKHQTLILDEIATIQNNINNQFSASAAPLVLGEMTNTVTVSDARAANLRNFFRKHDSALFPYADIIVRESDKNGLDYRLLPAIAMQESTLCRVIPDNSYNCWGWGITGSSTLRFSSYEEAITTVAKGIKKNYVDKRGLRTASEIMKVYTPASTGSWARGVNHVMSILE